MRQLISASGLLSLLLGYAGLVSVYFVARNGGLIAETDAASQSQAIRTLAETGELLPLSGTAYALGYEYTVVSYLLLTLTGLTVAQLQQVVYPLLSALLVLPAWALYREFVGRASIAALATLLLFTQPEFLFVVLRGSHERVTRILMLLAAWLLVRSFRFRRRPASFAVHLGFFYAVSFALVATNALFGTSFLAALCGATASAWAISRLWHARRGGMTTPEGDAFAATARRLTLAALAFAVLVFVVVFYVYPPSSHGLSQFNAVAQSTARLVLTTDAGSNPYAQVVEGWRHPVLYALLSGSDYVLLLVSAVIWLVIGARWALGRGRPAGRSIWLLWLLYGAFAAQGAFAVVADRTGLMGANLQHRTFPSFAMIAAPLVAYGLMGRSRLLPRLAPRASAAIAAPVMGALALLAMLKVTNEPSLSNKWTFYTPVELRAMSWAEAHLRDTAIWVGLDERLSTAYAIAAGTSDRGNRWDIYAPEPTTRVYVVSEVIHLQATRRREPLPPTVTENRIYDAGSTAVYRVRPRTPYQA